MQSSQNLLVLGQGENQVNLSEEDRESHMLISGDTGEGKSKFIEHLCRGDIKNGTGFIFLDSTTGGDTLYKILNYCAKIGHNKVILIDPYHRITHDKVIGLNPFYYNFSDVDKGVNGIHDAFRIIFNVKDPSDTPVIETYLPTLLAILVNAGMTLNEAKYFTVYDDNYYKLRRDQIIAQFIELNRGEKDANSFIDDNLITLQEALKYEDKFERTFGSTARRLKQIFRTAQKASTLSLMFGARQSLDFTELVANNWIILVNLERGKGIDTLQARLLGTILLNKIDDALTKLSDQNYRKDHANYKGYYYVYIDEAGEYVNHKTREILELKRKIGMRLILAHQFLGQFEDPVILKSIRSQAKIKIAFYMSDPEQRSEIVSLLGYGGELDKESITYALADQKKAQAVAKINKTSPRLFDTEYVNDTENDPRYIEWLYNHHPITKHFYFHPADILKDFSARFEGIKGVPNERKGQKSKQSNRTSKESNRPAEPTSSSDDESISSPTLSSDTDKKRRQDLLKTLRNHTDTTGKNSKDKP